MQLSHSLSEVTRSQDAVSPTNTRRRRYSLIPAPQLRREGTPPFLVDGLLPSGCLAVYYGQPGCGKSFVVVSLALSIATGTPLGSLKARQGRVVYVAAERAEGLADRMEAFRLEHGHDRLPTTLQFLPRPVPLGDADEIAAFVAELKQDDAPVLVIIDTLARCLSGDENSTRDMNAAVESIDFIRRETGAAVLLVHHTRKGDDTERGNTALRGAADIMHLVRKRDEVIEVTCQKTNDFPPLPSVHLELVPVGPSCVVRPLVSAKQSVSSSDTESDSAGQLRPDDANTLRVLAEADGPLSIRAWAKAANVSKSTLSERNSRWSQAGLTQRTDDGLQTVSPHGQLLLGLDSGEPQAA